MSRQSGSHGYSRVLNGDAGKDVMNLSLINGGRDDQMECKGYRTTAGRKVRLAFLIMFSAGLVLLIYLWRPDWWTKLLKVVCPLPLADTVLLKDEFGSLHPESIKAIRVEVKPPNEAGTVCEVSIGVVQEETDTTSLIHGPKHSMRYFDHRHVRYIWNSQKNVFTQLGGLDGELTCAQVHDDWGYGLSASEHERRKALYGENNIHIEVKSYFRLFVEEVLNPFYVFQVCSIILWSVDNYYVYALCIFLISAISICIELYETRKQRRTLRDMVGSTQALVTVVRGGQEMEVNTSTLVPGDLMYIPPNGCTMMVDAVLLSGNAIVNESMLTGESVPVTKTPLSQTEAEEVFSHEGHKRHILFCGTHIIQTRYYAGTKVKAVVVRTGFSTAKGELVCSILYPRPLGFQFYKDSIRFIMVLGILAVIGMSYAVVKLIHNKAEVYKIIFRVLDIITIIIPPALPAAMTVGTVYAQSRLKKQGIFCINPLRINICGKLKLICFDKTGTLTEDGLDLWGVVPTENNRFLDACPDPTTLSTQSHFIMGMATCHSLTNIDNKLNGDPLDLKMFNSTKWILEEPGIDKNRFEHLVPTVVRPVTRDIYDCNNQSETAYEVGIVRQFPFSSSRQRMSVITRVLGAPNMDCYCKGAPEKVISLCQTDTVPKNFHNTLKAYTQQGFRVIALAWGPLNKKVSWHQVQKIARADVESNMTFLGLLVLENMLKPQTTPVIKQLADACIRTVMITGDNMLTAVSVARQCQMIRSKETVIRVNATDPDGVTPAQLTFEYTDNDQPASETEIEPVPETSNDTDQLYQSIHIHDRTALKYHFALTGKSFAVIRNLFPEIIPKLIVRGTVFARMSPDQKTQLVESLQEIGYCVGMCGDGANDCGALKTAHAGISLSEAEASVASPFTSSVANIECVPTVIREGRAALVTSFGVFKYMALYSIVQFVSVLILYTYSTNFSDWMFLYIDLVITTTVAVLMGHTGAYKKLVVRRPPGSLMSPVNMFCILLHIGFVIGVQAVAVVYLEAQPWYAPFPRNPAAEAVACYEGNIVFLVSSFQYLLLAFVFSKGPPYRKRLWTNVPFLLALVVLTTSTCILLFHPFPFIIQLFKLKPFPPYVLKFLLTLLGIVCIHFLLAVIVESFLTESHILKRTANFIRRKGFPKNKYKVIMHEMDLTPSWPPIGEVLTPTVDSGYKPDEGSDS